jgi:acylphosphatase
MIQHDDNSEKRIGLRISGRVQGVGYRWFVVSQAKRLSVRGWVRNAEDGSVELEAEGSTESIAEFRKRVEKGPPAARVEHVEDIAITDAQLGDFIVVR